MSLFGNLWKSAREVIAGPQQTPALKTPQRTVTHGALARELFKEFPDDISSDVLWDRCSAAGLNMADVDRALDELRYAAEERAQVRVKKIDPTKLNVLDLTAIDSVRTRVKGSSYAVTFKDRAKFSGTEYLLVREPDNTTDPSAVAVYGKGRRVGYVSTSRAAALSPLLEQLGADAFAVGGAGIGEQGSRLWVDLPKAEALRAFARSRR